MCFETKIDLIEKKHEGTEYLNMCAKYNTVQSTILILSISYENLWNWFQFVK